MTPNTKQRLWQSRFSGFSLTEMMVAMVLGLVISGAVATVFVQSKKTYGTQERLSRIQENGRFAMHFLARDLRLAGYAGCLNELIADDNFKNNLKQKDQFAFVAELPVEGLEQNQSVWYPSTSSGAASIPSRRANTDAFSVRLLDPDNRISITTEMPSKSAELIVNTTNGLADGDIVMITDCASADLFQMTKSQTNADHVQHRPAGGSSTGNIDGSLSKSYGKDAKLMKFIGRRYYIRDLDGSPTLYRDTNGGNPEPLVDGVENLQILYGKDETGDFVPDVYLPAGHAQLKTLDDWRHVVAVRIGILVRSTEAEAERDENSYNVIGESVPATNDGYRRRVFTTTMILRNLAQQM